MVQVNFSAILVFEQGKFYLCEKKKQMRLPQDSVSKEAVLIAIQDMPDRIPIDELFDKIIFLYKIEIGLAQSKRGEVISMEEFREKIKTWRNPK